MNAVIKELELLLSKYYAKSKRSTNFVDYGKIKGLKEAIEIVKKHNINKV